MTLTFDAAQERLDKFISQFAEGYFPPLAQLARMMEELGELSRAVSHDIGIKKPKAGEAPVEVRDELGDLLVTIACFANAQGISLADAFTHTMDKVEKRDASRWTPKEKL